MKFQNVENDSWLLKAVFSKLKMTLLIPFFVALLANNSVNEILVTRSRGRLSVFRPGGC